MSWPGSECTVTFHHFISTETLLKPLEEDQVQLLRDLLTCFLWLQPKMLGFVETFQNYFRHFAAMKLQEQVKVAKQSCAFFLDYIMTISLILNVTQNKTTKWKMMLRLLTWLTDNWCMIGHVLINKFIVVVKCCMSPVDKSSKEQSDGLLHVLSAQPAPLFLHQQAQDVQDHLSQCCLRSCTQKNRNTQFL